MSEELGRWQHDGALVTCGVHVPHDFEYRGRYGRRGEKVPGSAARDVEVFDVYYCRRCLAEARQATGLRGYTTYGANPWEGEFIE